MSVEVDSRLHLVHDALSLNESEETWDRIATGIRTLQTLLEDDRGVASEHLFNTLRSFATPLLRSMISERSRLSGAALDLLSTAARELGATFDSQLSLFLPTLLTLCGRPNKVFANRSKACLINVIESTQSPQILSILHRSAKDKSISLRLAVAEATLACLHSFNPPDLQKDLRGQEIEAMIRSFATDANADIRKVGRKIFEAYAILLPNRVDKCVYGHHVYTFCVLTI